MVSGIVTAVQFVGDGSQLTGIAGGSGETIDTVEILKLETLLVLVLLH